MEDFPILWHLNKFINLNEKMKNTKFVIILLNRIFLFQSYFNKSYSSVYSVECIKNKVHDSFHLKVDIWVFFIYLFMYRFGSVKAVMCWIIHYLELLKSFHWKHLCCCWNEYDFTPEVGLNTWKWHLGLYLIFYWD